MLLNLCVVQVTQNNHSKQANQKRITRKKIETPILKPTIIWCGNLVHLSWPVIVYIFLFFVIYHTKEMLFLNLVVLTCPVRMKNLLAILWLNDIIQQLTFMATKTNITVCTMNKSELIDALVKEANLPSRTASSIVGIILDAMTETLVSGDNVEIRGFGSFTVREYKQYTGRNPKTGKKTQVKAKKLPFFKVGKNLREAVDNQK
jgi:integration host factor subunit beta